MTNSERFINWVASSRKAIVAGLAALMIALGTSAEDGLTLGEFFLAAGGALGSGVLTYNVPNAKR